jgi:hypothetical protein
VAILAAVLVAALLVARSCGATETAVSKDEAIEIARGEVDFTPDDVRVRLIKRGIQSQEFWLVGLARGQTEAVNVVIDADTGAVAEVRRAR